MLSPGGKDCLTLWGLKLKLFTGEFYMSWGIFSIFCGVFIFGIRFLMVYSVCLVGRNRSEVLGPPMKLLSLERTGLMFCCFYLETLELRAFFLRWTNFLLILSLWENATSGPTIVSVWSTGSSVNSFCCSWKLNYWRKEQGGTLWIGPFAL